MLSKMLPLCRDVWEWGFLELEHLAPFISTQPNRAATKTP